MVKISLKGVDGSESGPPVLPWVEKWPVWERWSVDQSSGFCWTPHTAEVGASEEVPNTLREQVSPWQIGALVLRWGPKLVMLMGHVWPYKIQGLYQITATEDSKIQDKATQGGRAPGADPKTWAVWRKLRGVEVGAGVESPAGNLQNGYWQMVSKSIKTFQKTSKNCHVWQMHKAGSPRPRGAALCSRGMSWRPGCCLLPSEDSQRQRGCPGHGWNCPSRSGASGLRF